MRIDLHVDNKEVIVDPEKVKEVFRTEMREEYEEVKVVPMDSSFHEFFWKTGNQNSYANETDLVEGGVPGAI